jgi:hypothetical protein
LSTDLLSTVPLNGGIIYLFSHAASFGQVKYLNAFGAVGLSYEQKEFYFGQSSHNLQQYPLLKIVLGQKLYPLSIQSVLHRFDFVLGSLKTSNKFLPILFLKAIIVKIIYECYICF